MEVIQINEGKWKIMLTEGDMHTYDITPEQLEEGSERARDAFFAILEQAIPKNPPDPKKERLFVQIYPCCSGGCELYILTLPPFEGRQEGRWSVGQNRHGLKTGCSVYTINSLDSLLELCFHLNVQGYTEDSVAYVEPEGEGCYLLVWDNVPNEAGLLQSAYPVLAEYGKRFGGSSAFSYCHEHSTCICPHQAVQRLGALFAPAKARNT